MSHALVPLGIEPKVWSNTVTARRATVSGYKPNMMVFSGSSGGSKTGFHPARPGGGTEGGGRPKGVKVENKMVTETAELMERTKEKRQDPEVQVIGDESHDVSSVSTTPKITGAGKSKRKTNNNGKRKKKKSTSGTKSKIKRLAATRKRNGGGSTRKRKK